MEKHLRQAGPKEWGSRDGHAVKDGRSARSRQPLEQLQSPSTHVYIPPSHSGRMRTSRGGSVGRGTSGTGHRSPASTIGHVIASVIGVTIVLLLVVGGLTAHNVYNSAKRVASEASNIMACVDKFETAVRDGNPQALRSAASDINGSAHGIQNELSSPWWVIASLVPVYGSDVKSAQTLADSMVDLSDNALSPLAYDSGVLSLSNLVSDSTINVDAISSLASTCQMAQPIVRRDAEAINALPDAHIEQFATVFRKVKGRLSSVDDVLTKANRILPVLPDMLGAGGQEKTYLVIAMSNAEMRAAGGFPGAWGELTVVDGRMSVANFDTIVHEKGFTSEDAGGEDAMLAGLSDTGYYSHTLPADMTTSPDFTRDGWLMASAWEHFKGTHVDGVIALDPVFLQKLMKLTDTSVQADGFTIDGSNAAKILLNDAYWKYGNDNDASDAFFRSVAVKSFDEVLSNIGSAQITDLANVLGTAAAQRRLELWMANDTQEDIIKEVGASGHLSTDEANPVLGIYVNDHTTAKYAYYLNVVTQIGDRIRNGNGSYSYSVTTKLINTADYETILSAPSYISGTNPEKKTIDTMIERPIILAPAGGVVTNMNLDGDGGMIEGTLYGFDCWTGTIDLRCGQTATLTYTVTTSANAASDLVLDTTPLAQDFS